MIGWSSWKKKEGIFCTVHFVWQIFFNICVLSQFKVYWIHFQTIHTFTYQKTLHHKRLLTAFKIVESLQCVLKLKSARLIQKLTENFTKSWLYWFTPKQLVSKFKDVLLDRIEHEYLFYCSNLVDNSWFLISNPHKYYNVIQKRSCSLSTTVHRRFKAWWKFGS